MPHGLTYQLAHARQQGTGQQMCLAPTSVARAAHKHGSSQPAKRQPPGNSISPALHRQAEKEGTVLYIEDRATKAPSYNSFCVSFWMQRGKKFWYKNGKFLIKYRIREYGWKKCPTVSRRSWTWVKSASRWPNYRPSRGSLMVCTWVILSKLMILLWRLPRSWTEICFLGTEPLTLVLRELLTNICDLIIVESVITLKLLQTLHGQCIIRVFLFLVWLSAALMNLLISPRK